MKSCVEKYSQRPRIIYEQNGKFWSPKKSSTLSVSKFKINFVILFSVLQENIYKYTVILVTISTVTYARTIPETGDIIYSSSIGNRIEANAVDVLPVLSRERRQSYQSYGDYYNDGGNDDYNNNRVNQRERQQFYANGQNNFYTDDRVDQQYAAPVAPAPSRRAPVPVPADSNKKYVYTPLFQYKETEQKHKKLFVPNLFG